jgi:hypothetical protein
MQNKKTTTATTTTTTKRNKYKTKKLLLKDKNLAPVQFYGRYVHVNFELSYKMAFLGIA